MQLFYLKTTRKLKTNFTRVEDIIKRCLRPLEIKSL